MKPSWMMRATINHEAGLLYSQISGRPMTQDRRLEEITCIFRCEDLDAVVVVVVGGGGLECPK